jgi:transposase-like protein
MVIMERQNGLWEMKCPKCESEKIVKNGKVTLKDNSSIQKYRCRGCTQRFNERTGTPMARLRTPAIMVSMAIKARTEGMGVRATGRVLDPSGNLDPILDMGFDRQRLQRALHQARCEKCVGLG